jgi:glycosyltransferase involved in cell wall biosynthesis/SAM-dependent methyltransferase
MRVLVVSDISPVVVQGGGERALWELAWRLAARGHALRVVSRAPEGVQGEMLQQGVPVRHFPAERRVLPRFLHASIAGARRAVDEEAAAHGADVLHLHQPLAALGALTSATGRRVPSLYTFHSPAPLEYRVRQGTTAWHRRGPIGAAGAAFLWVVERAALARATRIHVLSDFSAALLRRLYGIGGEHVVRIPGGVDLDRFAPEPDRAATRRKLGLPADRPVLFTLRNLEPRMGLDNLIHAMALVREGGVRPLLLVGGAGSLRPALEALVRAHGLEGDVEFLGFVDEAELPLYYAAADAFVLPTRALEGFGLVTVEALACGTPVLGTPVGATPEILTPLDPSLVFDDAGPEAIARGIGRFLQRSGDRDDAATLRAACRRHAEARYGWEQSVGELEHALAGLVAARAPRGPSCGVCGATVGSGFRRGTDRYLVCRRCGTAVMERPPAAAHLRLYYDREYPERFVPDRISPARAALLASAASRLGDVVPPGRFLDVGCGGGHLLRGAVERGWRPVGADVSHRACIAARATAGVPVVQADSTALPFRDRSLQAVALVNVLDHLGEPRTVLAEARRVLADGGGLLVRVPNGAFHRPTTRWLARLGPLGRRLARYPVLHVFSFTARGLRRLVEREGFRVLAARNSPLTAEGPAAVGAEPGRLPPLLRGTLGAVARGAAAATGGRWLLAPSIELWARRDERR